MPVLDNTRNASLITRLIEAASPVGWRATAVRQPTRQGDAEQGHGQHHKVHGCAMQSTHPTSGAAADTELMVVASGRSLRLPGRRLWRPHRERPPAATARAPQQIEAEGDVVQQAGQRQIHVVWRQRAGQKIP